MELASEFIIGIGGLVIGLAMLWFGMPNKGGENPSLFTLGFCANDLPRHSVAVLCHRRSRAFKGLVLNVNRVPQRVALLREAAFNTDVFR